MSHPDRPALSIIIPAHNTASTVGRLLESVCRQTAPGDEVIVVDDASTDDTVRVAADFPVRLERLSRRSGPAAARNRGAALARRAILVFFDADVVLHADTLSRGAARMGGPSVDAVIGSYDDAPHVRTLVSQFKNLAHHHTHQQAGGRVGTFWGACGFIRRSAFERAGGFDEKRFSRPSIEDLDLGWRLVQQSGCIVLDPLIQVTHLKAWTLGSLIKTDVILRAVPWTRGELARRRVPGELNADKGQWAAGLVTLVWLGAGLSAVTGRGAVVFLLATSMALLVNRRLFGLFWRKGGLRLLVVGFVLQQLYYLYAGVGCAIGVLLHLTGRGAADEQSAAAEA
jgi:GT2 family glycosyltransferase